MSVLFNADTPIRLIEIHAKALAFELSRVTDRSKVDSSKTQLRRFYQEFNNLRNYILSNSDKQRAYKEKEVAIKMLIPKATYALSRRKITGTPDKFIQWLVDNLTNINNETDVETFGYYFEALIGYYYSYCAR